MKLITTLLTNITIEERFRKDYGDLEALKLSIKENGLVQPIAVVELSNGKYKLLAGGRRFKACKELGEKEIPIRVFDYGMEKLDELTIELIENIHRKNLEWQEEVDLTNKIEEIQKKKFGKKHGGSKNQKGWSMDDTAKLIGKSKALVSEDCKLAEAMEVIPELKKCKNKSDAKKLLLKMHKEYDTKRIVQRIETQRKNTGVDKIRKQLVDNYIISKAEDGFFTGVKSIKSNSVPFVEVDPPYGVDLPKTKVKGEHSKTLLKNYSEVEKSVYPDFIEKVCEECYRILQPGGWIIFWYSTGTWSNMVFEQLANAGFKGNTIAGIWDKYPEGGGGATQSPNIYLPNSYETFYYMRKGDSKLHRPGRSNIFRYPAVKDHLKTHPTERPIELMMDIYSTFVKPGSPGIIPFLGSGTGILAGANLGMQMVGWDLSQEFKDSYIMKVEESEPPKYRSYEE